MDPSKTWPARKKSLKRSGRDPARLFVNPFTLEDILIFDDSVLRRFFASGIREFDASHLARGLQGASEQVIARIEPNLPADQLISFHALLRRSYPDDLVRRARQRLLDRLFWDLIYWKVPDLYHYLTEGETLHPDIFQRIAPDIYDRVVLDAAAGSGRATLECLRYGANIVYAVDPAPGLLRLLEDRLERPSEAGRVLVRRGSFDFLPLADASVDLSLSCAAFSADALQGGEPGLAELRRVTRTGGKIVLISPRPQDYRWLARHGFRYVACAELQDASVHFRSTEIALRCAQLFYARNPAVIHYILERQRADIPYIILGFSQLHDYCWLTV